MDALKATGCDAVLVVDRTRWANLPGALATADLLVTATPIGNEAMRQELGPAADG